MLTIIFYPPPAEVKRFLQGKGPRPICTGCAGVGGILLEEYSADVDIDRVVAAVVVVDNHEPVRRLDDCL